MRLLTLFLVAMVTVTCCEAHGRMIVPPERAAMWRYQYNVPKNNDDMGLDCGGQGVSWTPPVLSEYGRCGVCGDPWNAKHRENEAGGKYATGIIGATYTEGQVISVVLTITVSHGGWSEFRLCPNNNVHRVVSQDCLDKHTLLTVGGKTRFYHPVHTGNVTIQLVLPKGITCSQCVLQWWWKTNANNNCRPDTGKDCCIGCGRQEIFVNCADVSIVSSSKPGSFTPRYTPAPPTAPPRTLPPIVLRTTAPPPRTIAPTTVPRIPPRTNRPPVVAVPTTQPPRNNGLPDRFVPIMAGGNTIVNNTSSATGVHQHTAMTIAAGFLPIDVGFAGCGGSTVARLMYGLRVADRWCQSVCRIGTCPATLCNDDCRRV